MSQLTNLYKDEVDFSVLALQDKDFAKVLKSNGQLDFSNPESVQQLTESLLKRDFNLQISLPPDRLCPPVSNRLNYLLWIQSLLETTSDSYDDTHDPEREVIGLDIGTGSSCIYPLLACSKLPKWRFIGTDIDERSMQFAKQNVQQNAMGNRIKLLQTQADGLLIPLDTVGIESIDFTICNPPFYTSVSSLLASAQSKQRPPFSACTGSESEMVTPGGEVAFVSRMVDQSLILKERVQWYSSMLGILSSVTVLVERLKKEGIGNFAVTEFVQGKTRRWGIAWSFGDLRPRMGVARGSGSVGKGCLPFPSEYAIVVSGGNASRAGQCVNDIISKLRLKWLWKFSIHTGIGFTQKAVWSRAARRHSVQNAVDGSEDDDDAALGFKIYVEAIVGEGQGVRVLVRWMKGHDSVLFESLCGMLKRKVEEGMRS
ncbi:hypothetical protein BJ875DRAFT_384648 [Amylocarpus encephaloides]|uniref:U6 small nuclear RNA (adenine-(43)-N(6))-methyltransferase n=1 Tax=Amylocarpus encephaloides TaxID=45428 RepID=A0A9P7YC92_9HELO|nr:hypothetical protein BJ875DRAFT_384648 [Amylocarpus encephaloides]